MAKKKSNPTTPTKDTPIEKVEPIYSSDITKRQAEDDALKWFTRLSVDRRIKINQLNKRLIESLNDAKGRMIAYGMRFKEQPSYANRYNAEYWRQFYCTLSEYLNIELETENVAPQELRDFFEKSIITFKEFEHILEVAGLTVKGKMKIHGISYMALATYQALKTKGIIKYVNRVAFRNCFTIYYGNKKFESSTYSMAIDRDKGDIKELRDAILSAFDTIK